MEKRSAVLNEVSSARCIGLMMRVVFAFSLLSSSIMVSAASPETPPSVSIATVVAAIREKRFDDALRMSQAGLKASSGDARLWTLEGMAYAGLGKASSALSAYQHALKVAPRYLPALEGAAQTAFHQGDAEAKPLLLRVLEQRPDDPTSHAMLGSLAYRSHHCDDAIEHFQKAESALASEPNALGEYGVCLGGAERFDEATRVFSQLLALDEGNRSARYNLALSQWNAKQSDAALATLRPLLEISPAEEDALTLAADISEEAGNTQAAIDLLRRAILEHPKTVDAYLQFAFLSGSHASFQVGIDMINAGLTQLPEEARLYLARGVMYGQMGESEKAMSDLEHANQLAPQLSFAHAAEGVLQSQQHKSAEALATFRAAAKAHPNDAYTQYLLAESLSGESKEPGSVAYREEIVAASRAAQLDPTLVAAHDLLAALYLEDGLVDKSIEQSELALKRDPSDEQALYHLMLALRKTDRKREVPALVQRLTDLHKQAASDGAHKTKFQIYEVPDPEIRR